MTFSEFIETNKLAFESMSSNKLRSLLASLGVVIGISFVIIMGWILNGLDKALQDTFNLIGTDMMYIDRWEWAGNNKNWKLMEQRKQITLQQANDFCSRIKGAEAAIPLGRKWGVTIGINGDNLKGISVQGVKSEYSITSSGQIESGRFFTKFEETQSRNVAVIGFGVQKTLFPNKDALGKEIKINGHKYTIVGVITKQSTVLMDFLDNQIYIPLQSFLSDFGAANRSFSIAVKVGSSGNIDNLRAETIGLMRTIRNIKPGSPDDFSINESKAFESSAATLRLYVWSIGIGMTVLSFIVGIIGIMNIMFVSVTERTKEIGIRKAIGAKKASILTQFIVESSALCLIGAVMSFILCSGIILLAYFTIPKLIPAIDFLSPIIPLNLLFIATIVSIFVGVLAGFIPAMRAANFDPVNALRYE